MSEKNEIGIETPSGTKRKADELRESFAKLVASYPDDKTVIETAREYDKFHYQITQETTPLGQIFATDELEKWQRRYATEYSRLIAGNPEVTTSAPKPTDITPPKQTNSFFWVAVVIAGTATLYTIYKVTSKD